MSQGQRTFKVYQLASIGEEEIITPLCNSGVPDCEFSIPVFSDNTGKDLNNDKTAYLVPSSNLVQSTVITLQKNVSSVWTGVATLNNNLYGTWYPMGFSTKNPKYSGYVIDWSLILPTFGEGNYRLKIAENRSFDTLESFSYPFCLREYNCSVDNTVRLEWTNNEGLGDINSDKKILDFTGLNWFNQIRIPNSFFGYPTSEYEKEDIQFSNGQIEDVKDVQTETYTLKLGAIPMWLHRIIKTYAFQSGTVTITDYSSNNPEGYVRKAVRLTSDYAPRYKLGSKCAPVTVEVQPTYNRLEKFRCL